MFKGVLHHCGWFDISVSSSFHMHTVEPVCSGGLTKYERWPVEEGDFWEFHRNSVSIGECYHSSDNDSFFVSEQRKIEI